VLAARGLRVVLLGEEEGCRSPGDNPDVEADGEAGAAGAPPPVTATGEQDGGPPVAVVVRIKPLDCGQCFDLQAEGSGGRSPYEFERAAP
jgi:hypothetical protein